MQEEFRSEGLRLFAHAARPPGHHRVPGLVVVPGFPRGTGGAATVVNTYRGVVDRVAAEAGWAAMTYTPRGTHSAEGDFSIEGWLADVRAAIDVMEARPDVGGVWLAGFRLGGSLGIVTTAADDRVRGLVTSAAPASLKTWVRDPAWFLRYCRRVGVLRTEGFPPDPSAWTRAIADLDVVAAASRVPPRPWMILHGSDDDVVPVDDARRLAAAAPGAELRVVQNGVHRLRHDPRAFAALLGWLDRQVP